MSPHNPNPISLALTRLRRGVVLGCLLVATALIIQTVLWSLVSFTELRFEQPDATAHGETPLIVSTQPTNSEPRKSTLPIPGNGMEKPAEKSKPLHRQTSTTDQHFDAAFNLAGGIGRGAMVLVTVFIAIGVIVGVSASVPGIDQGVSALMIAVLVSLLVLPFGGAFGFPWQDGALSRYEYMTTRSDAVTALHIAVHPTSDATSNNNNNNGNRNSSDSSNGRLHEMSAIGMSAIAIRFGAFPTLCLLGVTWLGFRFAAAVEAAIHREDMKLDPALEREASNISPTSLHGARNANLFSNLSKNSNANGTDQGRNGSSQSDGRSIRQPNQGKAPARLI